MGKCKEDIVRQEVEKILKANALTRNSDKALILAYLERFTPVKRMGSKALAMLTKAIFEMPSFETITRRRREIQETGQHVATTKTQQGRMAQEKAMRLRYR